MSGRDQGVEKECNYLMWDYYNNNNKIISQKSLVVLVVEQEPHTQGSAQAQD